jgi:hypothetical protein
LTAPGPSIILRTYQKRRKANEMEKTYEECKAAFNLERATPSGYRRVPLGWTIEELRQAAINGYIKLVAGRYQFVKARTTPREKGMGWRLL